MDKKKKPIQPSDENEKYPIDTEQPQHEAPAFVTEIVEEEDGELAEDMTGKTVEELETQSIKPTEKEFIHENDFQGNEMDEEEKPAKAEDKKQVVEELFSPKGPDQLVDIALHNKKNGGQPIIIWALIIISVALVTGGGMILLSRKTGEKKEIVIQTPATVTPTPAPTVAPVKKDELKIQVLNGGGKPGAASKMKSLLTEKGYTVTAVGNTDEYVFETTVIEVKSGNESALELLKIDLSQEYTLGTTAATLASDSDYDVVVTVGK